MKREYFAAHDSDGLYGIGTNKEKVLLDAKQWLNGFDNLKNNLVITRISARLYYKIKKHGWCNYRQSYEIKNNLLVETTSNKYRVR